MLSDAGPLLAALAEPTRLRIVGLLHAAPRAVGELATELGARQPQVTKHLQTLQRAGLVTVHPLGQRRIYALRREPFGALREWLEPLTVAHPSEDALARYEAGIAAEAAALRSAGGVAGANTGAAADGGGGVGTRTLSFSRDIGARRDAVWAAWTTETGVRAWWHPRHFTVADATVDAVAGGTLRIVMAEGDGTRHTATGRFLAVTRPRSLRFELAPVDAAGERLFTAVHDVTLDTTGPGRTHLDLRVRVSGIAADAAPVLAGMQPGWEQTLDALVETLHAAPAA